MYYREGGSQRQKETGRETTKQEEDKGSLGVRDELSLASGARACVFAELRVCKCVCNFSYG